MVVAIAFTACQKDDNPVDMSKLVGKWNVFNDDPNFSADGSVTYTFDKDGGYKLAVYDFLSNTELTHEGTYMVSTDLSIVTLSEDKDGDFAAQYFLLKLNSKEMKWKGAAVGYEPRETKFVRATD